MRSGTEMVKEEVEEEEALAKDRCLALEKTLWKLMRWREDSGKSVVTKA